MKAKPFLFIVTILVFLLSEVDFAWTAAPGQADTVSQSSFLEVVLNFVILLIVGGCFFYTKKIESFLKGGELSLAWLLILGSFLILFFLQVFKLGNSMNVIKLDLALYSFFKLLWVILLGWGIYRLKKVLS